MWDCFHLQEMSPRSGPSIPILWRIYFTAPLTHGITVGPHPRSECQDVLDQDLRGCVMALLHSERPPCLASPSARIVRNPPLLCTIARRTFISSLERGDPSLGLWGRPRSPRGWLIGRRWPYASFTSLLSFERELLLARDRHQLRITGSLLLEWRSSTRQRTID